MAIYKMIFARTVTTSDYVEREIEAESDAEAQAKCEEMAAEFNHRCPDDVQASDGFEYGEWDFEPAE